MTVEEIKINGDKGTPISAYVARPSGPGPFPGVVLVHHLPAWSEWYCEQTRKFAHHGYIAICANLYERNGQGNPDDVAAKVRAEGGVPDAQVVGDTEGAVKWMRAQPGHNGKVGLRLLLRRAAPSSMPARGGRRRVRRLGRPRGDG
jgi:carboxymethylenebutenolidase